VIQKHAIVRCIGRHELGDELLDGCIFKFLDLAHVVLQCLIRDLRLLRLPELPLPK
jgi:hypothetical protein